MVALFVYSGANNEAALLETALRPGIPLQGIQVEPLQIRLLEDVVYQKINSLRTIASAPVIAVADYYPYLCLFPSLLHIVVHTVSDMLAIQTIYSEPAAIFPGVFQLLDVIEGVLLDRQLQGRGGIVTG